MIDPTQVQPCIAAWLAAQQAFARLVTPGAAPDAATGTTQQLFADQYRLLFGVPGSFATAAAPAADGASLLRYHQAAERFARLLNDAASDAGRRLGAALARSGPDAPPITTWRELHALWIECGEAAWSAAAHREEFAAAQAELLAALVVLRAPGQRP